VELLTNDLHVKRIVAAFPINMPMNLYAYRFDMHLCSLPKCSVLHSLCSVIVLQKQIRPIPKTRTSPILT